MAARGGGAIVLIASTNAFYPEAHTAPDSTSKGGSLFLEDLAAACEVQGRSEFLLVIAPLRLAAATGSPVNPIAIL